MDSPCECRVCGKSVSLQFRQRDLLCIECWCSFNDWMQARNSFAPIVLDFNDAPTVVAFDEWVTTRA